MCRCVTRARSLRCSLGKVKPDSPESTVAWNQYRELFQRFAVMVEEEPSHSGGLKLGEFREPRR